MSKSYSVGDVVAALGNNPVAVVKLLNDAGRRPLLNEETPDLAARVARTVLMRLWVDRVGMREASKIAVLLRQSDAPDTAWH
jgi:hypothetical protein